MIQLIKSFRLWVATIRYYEKSDYPAAISSYKKFAEIRSPKTSHRAFYGDLLLLNGEQQKAIEQYETVISDISHDQNFEENPVSHYIWSYCNMTRCGIRGSEDREKYYQIAKGLKVRSSLRKLLPISPT